MASEKSNFDTDLNNAIYNKYLYLMHKNDHRLGANFNTVGDTLAHFEAIHDHAIAALKEDIKNRSDVKKLKLKQKLETVRDNLSLDDNKYYYAQANVLNELISFISRLMDNNQAPVTNNILRK